MYKLTSIVKKGLQAKNYKHNRHSVALVYQKNQRSLKPVIFARTWGVPTYRFFDCRTTLAHFGTDIRYRVSYIIDFKDFSGVGIDSAYSRCKSENLR